MTQINKISVLVAFFVQVIYHYIQQYVIKFVTDLRQVGDFLRILRFPPPIKFVATI